jgi:MFS transporter, ACS family, tartrate transporter
MSDVQATASCKFRWRIVLPIIVLIVASSLDRVNISFAALQMNSAIGLTAQTYGFAVGIFFVGYLLCQFPSTALLMRIGARRWVTASVVAWGLVAAATAFVRNAQELYVLRFLLGCAESGFAPGIVYYCSTWMPPRFRANTIALTLLAVPLSVIIGGPLCGWLMTIGNPLALPGWRWMLLLEGCVTVLLGAGAYACFVDRPADAAWLSAAEKQWLANTATPEPLPATRSQPALAMAARDARTWLAAGVWCTTLIGANGMVFWLPQVIKELASQLDSDRGPLAIGVLSALPWLGVGLGMVLNSWHSDRAQERYRHVGVALGVAMAALLLASVVPAGGWSLALLVLGGFGLGSAQGVFWSIPAGFLQRSALAAGVTLINLIGNLGSLAGPYVIGVLRANTESFAAPIWFVAAVMGVGALLLVMLQARPHVQPGWNHE